MRRALWVAALAAASCGTTGTTPLGGTSGGATGGGATGGGTGGVCLLVNAQCGSTLSSGCCAGLSCVSNDNDSECVVPVGGACSQDFNCESQSCDGGSCQCQTLGSASLDGAGCCPPLTLQNGSGAGHCCGSGGFACQLASDCCSDNCQSGHCL